MMVHRTGGGWGGAWGQSWRMSKEQSGGTLMEVNAHEIDFIRWVCGEAQQVYAGGGNYITPQMDYPDIALVTITFGNGAVGFLHASQATLFGGYGGRLDCTEGSAEFPTIWGEHAGVRYRRKDASETTFLPLAEMNVGNPVQKELAAFVEAVRTDTDPPVTGRDGRAAVEIAQAAYQSIETGQAVALPLT
jgi:myo-inositol 2-dehydrogenase/D-chiro-inositol 1-dehydrogenase